tara:strand:+ start:298 stop:786 length:489 start_codon:yes stop_codon:yes gene_type:complete
MIRTALAFFLVLLLGAASCETSSQPEALGIPELDRYFSNSVLQIEANDGRVHEFRIFLATTPDQQRRGLMFIRQLPADVGMLFIYEQSSVRSMWMKNTYIPLDLVFAKADGTVSSIIENATPQTLDSRSSVTPVKYVLELNAGTAKRLNIGKRSRLIWSGDG